MNVHSFLWRKGVPVKKCLGDGLFCGHGFCAFVHAAVDQRSARLGVASCGYRAGMSFAFLYTSPDRVLYRGPLGQPRPRVFGAAVCYVGLRGRLRWHIPQAPQPGRAAEGEGDVLSLSPGVGHHIAVSQGPVLCYLIEPESVAWPDEAASLLPSHLAALAPSGVQAWRERLMSLGGADLAPWQAEPRSPLTGPDAQLDRLLLGQPLPARVLDPRIEAVVERVRSDPALAWQAADAAAHCGLSASRFMHLFKAEVGVGWRAFRAWKRARGLLNCVHSGENLTQLALTLGYPDATHFSHAIRHVTGLRPSDIMSGSRHLGVWSEIGVSPGAAS